ncbi:MFS transporter [Mycobacterium rhizamassiliense]|nr:MFS transporter [Mycobacterium rhizamassiliense]
MTRSGEEAVASVADGQRAALPSAEPRGRCTATNVLFAGLLAVLLATGWAANHFAGLIPAISDQQHLGRGTLDAIFGIYAVGLLPGLLIGGRASDVVGRQSVAWVGSVATLLATVAMLASQHSGALLIGRLVLGVGVGLVISSCTAWASDLRGTAGAAVAGAVLTAGFAVGPFASGVIASAGAAGVWVSFLIAAVLLVVATAVTVLAAQRAIGAEPTTAADSGRPAGQGTWRALSWALPLAPWVFASATLAFVTIPTRMHTGLAAPLAAGTAALIANGVSGISQLIARARRWGPQAGTVGALLAALGYAVTAAVPSPISLGLGVALLVVLGCASGLLLREGLIDLEAAAPQHLRGALTGAFYTVSYLGFGLPMLLSVIGSARISAIILTVMAVLATAAALGRAARLRRDSHRQN